MIYTVTLNPALDYVLSVPEAGDEPACRADAAALLPGGKGVNVSGGWRFRPSRRDCVPESRGAACWTG